MASDVTPGDVLTMALQTAGIVGEGQVARAAQINTAFTRLNWMLFQWRMKRWLVYRLVSTGFASTGAVSYTVGPGGNYDLPFRPDRIEAAFLRQETQPDPLKVDYPLSLLESREDYDRIAMKQLSSFPAYVWYDPDLPLGRLYPWPVPQNALYSVYITTKLVVDEFTSTAEVINAKFPPEYFQAIEQNLAVILREAYTLPPKPLLVQMAKASTNVLRGANAAVPRLQMPQELLRPGIYNVYSDQVR